MKDTWLYVCIHNSPYYELEVGDICVISKEPGFFAVYAYSIYNYITGGIIYTSHYSNPPNFNFYQPLDKKLLRLLWE